MRLLIVASFLGMALSLSSLATATRIQSFETTVEGAITEPIKLEVLIGDDLAYRANNIPKDRAQRSNSRLRLNNGFADNGHYGEASLESIRLDLEDDIIRRFEKKGITINDDAAQVLRVYITDARNNRPTQQQLTEDINLSFKSLGVGGATIEGELFAADGSSLGVMSYAYYEEDIADVVGVSRWYDANRAFQLFARKAAKAFAPKDKS